MNSQKFLDGKKILITSYSYASFGGAELNSVELAEQLVQFGAQPYFFSYDIDGPLAKYINEKFSTEVLTDNAYYLAESEEELKNTQLNIGDYDYIWVGANTIPLSIIKQINSSNDLPKFIFIHMSPLIAFPLDAPLLPELEKKIASKILSIGEKTTTDCIYRILGEDIPLEKWYNPAPREFKLLKKRSGKLKKIAVISSNYPSDEILNIKDEIVKHGIEIDYIGKFNDNLQIVDAKFYDKYDLIIGIGKNAKYSLVSGVPIYVYGRFGGGGYLNKNNYDTNNEMNFSGRGFSKKPPGEIANEIITSYQRSLEFHEKNRDKFIQEFSLDVVAERLFRELEIEKPKKTEFSNEYINWLVSMQINIIQRLQTTSAVRNAESKVRNLEVILSARNIELFDIYHSKSWKITKPLRAIKKIIK